MIPVPSSTILGAVLKAAERHSRRNALWVDGRLVSYEELVGSARSLAATIVESGATDKSKQCAVFAHRSLPAYAGLLAAQLAGMAYVPLSPKFPPSRTQRMLENSGASVVIVDHTCMPHAQRVLSNITRPMIVILVEADNLPAWASDGERHRVLLKRQVDSARLGSLRDVTVHELAYIVFTSGSTGQPKGVAIRQTSVATYARSAALHVGATHEDRFTQLPDLTFDLSVHDLYACWASGACLYSVPDTALLAPDDFVRKHELTMWCSVPSVVSRLKQFNRLKPNSLPSIRGSMFCGEALPAISADDWMAAAPNTILENFYGPTEATCALTHFRHTPGLGTTLNYSIVPLGDPFEGQETAVLGPDMSQVAEGETGELYLAGSQLSPGYWMAPELNRDRFVELHLPGRSSRRWYRTGDLASWYQNVGLVYRGRSDDQVKIAGFRVELQEIEGVIRAYTGASSVAVIPWPIAADGAAQGVIAFVAHVAVSPKELIQYCAEKLPTYMVPKEVVSLPELPLNPNGKIDRKQLFEKRQSMENTEGKRAAT